MRAVENFGGKSHKDEVDIEQVFPRGLLVFWEAARVLSVNLGAAPVVQGWS